MNEEFWEGAWQVVRVLAIWMFLILAPQLFMTMAAVRDYYEMKIEQEKNDEDS